MKHQIKFFRIETSKARYGVEVSDTELTAIRACKDPERLNEMLEGFLGDSDRQAGLEKEEVESQGPVTGVTVARDVVFDRPMGACVGAVPGESAGAHLTAGQMLEKLLAAADENPFRSIGDFVEHSLGGTDAIRATLTKQVSLQEARDAALNLAIDRLAQDSGPVSLGAVTILQEMLSDDEAQPVDTPPAPSGGTTSTEEKVWLLAGCIPDDDHVSHLLVRGADETKAKAVFEEYLYQNRPQSEADANDRLHGTPVFIDICEQVEVKDIANLWVVVGCVPDDKELTYILSEAKDKEGALVQFEEHLYKDRSPEEAKVKARRHGNAMWIDVCERAEIQNAGAVLSGVLLSEFPGLTESDLDEHVTDLFASHASDKNNEGVTSQLEFLLENMDINAVRALLRETAPVPTTASDVSPGM